MADDVRTGLSRYKENRYNEAVKIWRKLADTGDGLSMLWLGTMYDEGLGVKKDLSQAYYWWSQASEIGVIGAHYFIGSMYFRGDFVQKDLEQAAYRFRLDAEKDFDLAQYSLGYMYEFGEFFVKDLVAAAIWYYLSADHDNKDAKIGVDRVMPQLTSGERAAVHASCVKWIEDHENRLIVTNKS